MEDATKKSSDVGIIVPPPDLRNIVEKTAQFVAKNGVSFEQRIIQSEKNNPKFHFLLPDDPYNAYYEFKVKELREGGPAAKPTTSTKPQEQKETKKEEDSATTEAKPAVVIEPLEPPARVFTKVPPPTYSSPLEVNVMKLTAQFIARHGKQFFAGIASREHKNPQFDFLRPSHAAHPYFQALIDSYTCVIEPKEDPVKGLSGNYQEIMTRCTRIAEWERREQKKRAEMDEEDQERQFMSQIDWHDFVVVETITFEEGEGGLKGPVAPPTTAPAEVDDVEMEIEEDMDMDEDEPAAGDEDLPILKDYQAPTRRAGAHQYSAAKGTQVQVCPRCGQEIPVEEMAEHMRIELLDPKWREQKQIAAEKQRQSTLAAPEMIGEQLKSLAHKRTDIFGEYGREMAIGTQVLPGGGVTTDQPAKPVVQWDGHKGSIPAAKQAGHDIGDMMRGQPAKPAAPSGPSYGPSSAPPPAPGQPPMMQHGVPPGMGMGMGAHMMPGMAPFHQAGQMGAHMANPSMMPPKPVLAPPVPAAAQPPMPGTFPPPSTSAAPPAFEPAAKRPRVEVSAAPPPPAAAAPPLPPAAADSPYTPEREWIAGHPGAVTLSINVPNDPARADNNFKGQVEQVTVEPTDTMKTIKQKLQPLLGNLPANRQKLKLASGVVPKDSNTVAFYNLESGKNLALSMKERGGRR